MMCVPTYDVGAFVLMVGFLVITGEAVLMVGTLLLLLILLLILGPTSHPSPQSSVSAGDKGLSGLDRASSRAPREHRGKGSR
jgi:hypothetical protein